MELNQDGSVEEIDGGIRGSVCGEGREIERDRRAGRAARHDELGGGEETRFGWLL